MFNDLHWSIYPGAEVDAKARLMAYVQHCISNPIEAGPAVDADNRVDAGPAMDAERDGLPIQVAGTTAIVDLSGIMIRRAGAFARMFGITGTDGVRMAIEAADADTDVEQIVLRVDSPGGSVAGLEKLSDAIVATGKPIVAQVEGIAASAALWVATQADRLLVESTDLVGSIGVRMLLFDLSKLFEKEGMEAVPIDTGEFKSAGALGTEITKSQRADFQRIVDFFFDAFVARVSAGRHLNDEEVRKIADGRMFTPAEALKNGLIDGISTFEQTMASFHEKRPRQTGASRARLNL